jgi:hypothetical protein
MNTRGLLLFLVVIPLGLQANPSSEAKPVVSKTAPRLEPTELEGPKGNLNPSGTGDVGALPTAENPRASTDSLKSISQNIEAASHDEVPIVLEPPPVNLPFKDVVGFARPGQTENVLTGPVDHLPANEMLGLAVLDFRQGVSPLQFQIPSPPFVRMEVPGGFEASHWSFRVEDQMEKIVFQTGGMRVPQDVVSWDGFKEGAIVLLAGVVYQPVLKLTDIRGIPQQYFGDPIQLDVLQFTERGVLHVEFRNPVLFQRDSADFVLESAPLVRSMLNLLRRNAGTPFQVTVYEDERGRPLAEKRVEKLKRFLEDALVSDSDIMAVKAEPAGGRGSVTEFLITAPVAGDGS